MKVADSLLLFLSVGVCAAWAQGRVEHLQTAAKLIGDGRFGSAEIVLQPLLAGTPDPLALNLLGLIRMRQQRPAQAEDLFRQSIAGNARIMGPRINLARLHAETQPLASLQECREALQIAPDNAEVIGLLKQVARQSASRSLQSGDIGGALTLVSTATSALPGDAELLFEYGMIVTRMGRRKEAKKAFEDALVHNPAYADAEYALAREYLQDNNADAAERYMRAYLSRKPEDATGLYGLGYILMAEQKVPEAKVAFEKSVALQPSQTESVFELGEIAEQEQRPADARAFYLRVLDRNANHAGALTGLGVIAYRSGEYREAKGQFERAVASDSTYQKAHYYYALTLTRLGDKDEAAREYKIARSLEKPHAGTLLPPWMP